jgi:hypothetical protein
MHWCDSNHQTNTTMTRSIRLLFGALTLGLLCTGLSAQEKTASAPGGGLLGESYAGLTYDSINIDGLPVDASGFSFEFNHPLQESWDLNFQYNYWRTESFYGTRATVNFGGLGVRFHSDKGSARPFVGAGVGWAGAKAGGISESSFAWQAEVGVEFQAGNNFTITPMVNYQDASDVFDGTTNYGVKANYWFNNNFGLRAGVMANDDSDVTYSVGFNVRF